MAATRTPPPGASRPPAVLPTAPCAEPQQPRCPFTPAVPHQPSPPELLGRSHPRARVSVSVFAVATLPCAMPLVSHAVPEPTAAPPCPRARAVAATPPPRSPCCTTAAPPSSACLTQLCLPGHRAVLRRGPCRGQAAHGRVRVPLPCPRAGALATAPCLSTAAAPPLGSSVPRLCSGD
ncbi:predicted GPI-anchored protein 58 [Miscanthus floridulus]|uniref:predicted GPI-anchored protein 58 n=1 Tax=Miscanthus floridulus TaxID=154761 RepID=UPI00345ABB6E